MIKKDRSAFLNKTYLLKMLLTLYQAHLQSQLNRADYLLLACLIQLLQTIKQVRLEALAQALPLPIIFESRRRRLQRFLSLPQLTLEALWFPILKAWLKAEFDPGNVLYIAIDRTSWGCNNLMMISLIVDKRAIPIYFELLPKLGSSNFLEQKTAISQVLPLLRDYKIVVLGDREFCSVHLGNWLRESSAYFWSATEKKRGGAARSGDLATVKLLQLVWAAFVPGKYSYEREQS